MSRVLVVDDNRDLADDLVEILQAEGHDVIAAYGGRDALAVTADHAYDAAVVDIRMPDMDGVALVGQLMARAPEATYLFMTGYSNDRTVSEAMAVSQRAVLTKPIDIARLIRLLKGSTPTN